MTAEKPKRRPHRATGRRPTGRPKGIHTPIKYKPEFDELAMNYCLLGGTNADLANFFEVSETAIKDWMKLHPAFAEAVRAGRAHADAKVAASLYGRAINGDVVACIFWLKNRCGWRDRQDVHETKDVRYSGKMEYTLSVEARAMLEETMAQIHADLPVSLPAPHINGGGKSNGEGH